MGVIGGSVCPRPVARQAYELGRGIAGRGWVLVCGGMGGVMEEACRGAREAAGVTIGILPGGSRAEANPYLSYSLPTGLGEGRNLLVVRASDVLVALAGSFGTLSEIALAAVAGVPVVGLGSWKVRSQENAGRSLFRLEAGSPVEALAAVEQLLREGR